MIHELDRVVLTTDLPALGLVRGDVGTAVLCHSNRGYEVEFVALDGETIAVTSVTSDHVRLIAAREIAQARVIEAL